MMAFVGGTMKYYKVDTLGDDSDEDLAFVDDMISGTGYARENYRTGLGDPTADIWPADAHVRTRKGGRKLSDLIGTTNSEMYVSRKVAETIRAVLLPADLVEILPLTIKDSRGRVLSRDYFVINPVGTVDCIDRDASDVTWSQSKPDKVIGVRNIVLDSGKVPQDRSIFRVKEDPGEYIISARLADPLRGETSNLFWTAVEVR